MENNQEARTGGKRQNFWKKNIYTLILSIKEQLWRVFKLNFDILSFLRLSNIPKFILLILIEVQYRKFHYRFSDTNMCIY